MKEKIDLLLNYKTKKLCANSTIQIEIEVCIEEMSELIKELAKHQRNIHEIEYAIRAQNKCPSNSHDSISNIINEIADVENTISNIKHMFSINDDVVKAIRLEKLNRQLKRMDMDIKEESE